MAARPGSYVLIVDGQQSYLVSLNFAIILEFLKAKFEATGFPWPTVPPKCFTDQKGLIDETVACLMTLDEKLNYQLEPAYAAMSATTPLSEAVIYALCEEILDGEIRLPKVGMFFVGLGRFGVIFRRNQHVLRTLVVAGSRYVDLFVAAKFSELGGWTAFNDYISRRFGEPQPSFWRRLMTRCPSLLRPVLVGLGISIVSAIIIAKLY